MSWLNTDIIVNATGATGYVVGYEDDRLQVLLDGEPIDEPRWFRKDEVANVAESARLESSSGTP